MPTVSGLCEFMCVGISVCVHAYVRTCLCVLVCMCVYMSAFMCVCVLVCACVYVLEGEECREEW